MAVAINLKSHVVDSLMDGYSVSYVLSGVAVGWYLRGFFPQKEDPIPCNCNCACSHHLVAPESTSWHFPGGVVVAVLVVLITLVANLALVFRVTWTQKGDESERALVVSQQKGHGKSKGVFNAPKGLQIRG